MGDAIMNDLIEKNTTWIDLKEEVPDEIDLQMLKEIKENPDCHELHHYTTVGDITAQITIEDQKQEYRTRLWAYNKLIGLQGILSAYRFNCQTLNEMAEHLEVSEEFLAEALECYRKKYGVCTKLDNYVIYFEPHLGVMEMI